MRMKYKIVVDSASDLTNDYIVDQNIGFEVCPLTINVGGKEYIDDSSINTEEMLETLSKCDSKTTSSCPAPGVFLNAYAGADYVFCITISSKLSGSYNSAVLAASMSDNKVHVIDSKLVCGAEQILVDEIVNYIHDGLSYEEICTKIDEKTKTNKLLFVLQKFDNLVRNGRMSKAAKVIASFLSIKPLCTGEDGEIKILAKIRTLKASLDKLVETIGKDIRDFSTRKCIVSHCVDEETANKVAELIRKTYNFKEVVVKKMRGLCSFYALEKGIIVSY